MRAIISEIKEVNSLPMVSTYEIKIDGYKDYSKFLRCDYIDAVMITYKEHSLSLFIDDEGLLKQGNYGREVEGFHSPLFGSIIFTGGVDKEGNTLPTPKEIKPMDIFNIVSEIKYITKG